ncbi:hypothetical protein X777_12355 [Ooceraea biroi]|uniref:Uncharacterized protein n=1 Tax=Ooceraea biroi TaxID=2015173 RepID=A0A026W088_OOCBI|nr:hypothetical protein X777_12355 [Ooceraea biroi]
MNYMPKRSVLPESGNEEKIERAEGRRKEVRREEERRIGEEEKRNWRGKREDEGKGKMRTRIEKREEEEREEEEKRGERRREGSGVESEGEREEREKTSEEEETDEGEEDWWKEMEKDEEERREREEIGKSARYCMRGIEGESKRERRIIMERMVEKLLGGGAELGEVEERKGEGGRWVLIVEMMKRGDRRKLLEKKGEAWRRWRIGLDEDLTMEERRVRWRLMERAKMERDRGKEVKVENRKITIEGVEWVWDKEEQDIVKRKKGEGKGKVEGEGRERKENQEEDRKEKRRWRQKRKKGEMKMKRKVVRWMEKIKGREIG